MSKFTRVKKTEVNTEVWQQSTYLYELDEPMTYSLSDEEQYETKHLALLFIDTMLGRDVQILPCESDGEVLINVDLMDDYNMKDIMDEFTEEDPDYVLKYAGIGF